MKTTLKLCSFLAALVLVGCAGGPKFGQVSQNFPPLASDQGRIFVYRKGQLGGAAVQPSVMMNGEKVGSSIPGGFFFLDRPAGNYQITTTTEVKRSLSLTLDPGQTRYVRLNIAVGFLVGHVYPELIETAKGEKEIQDCHFLRPQPPNP